MLLYMIIQRGIRMRRDRMSSFAVCRYCYPGQLRCNAVPQDVWQHAVERPPGSHELSGYPKGVYSDMDRQDAQDILFILCIHVTDSQRGAMNRAPTFR